MTIYSHRGLHGQVSETLGRRIVSGEIAEEATLDPDGLGAELSVSRTVVREVLRSLGTKGLVDARPRIGTFVLPRSRWNLLDADIMRWRGEGGPSAQLFDDLNDLRRLIEPWSARNAAERRTEEDLADIRRQLDAMIEVRETTGPAAAREHIDADIAFHFAVLRATGNELAQRLIVVLEPLLRFRDGLLSDAERSEEFVPLHAAVYDAIEARDPDAAERAALVLLDRAATDIADVLASR